MKFKSALVTQASGSVGGMTASRNRGGMYFRSRAIPTNPSTSFQEAVRTAMAQLVVDWKTALTQTQRDAWALYAFNTPVLNALGEEIKLSGQNMYIRGNVPRVQASETIAEDAPIVFDLGTFSDPSFTVDAANDETDVTFDNADDWANEDDAAMLVYASRPQDPSINYFQGPYRLAGVIQGDGTTPPTSPATLSLPFPVVAGQVVFFRTVVSRSDGRLSAPFRLSVAAT